MSYPKNTHVALSAQAAGRTLHVYACTAGWLRTDVPGEFERCWFELFPRFERGEQVTTRAEYRRGHIDLRLTWLTYAVGLSYAPRGVSAY